MRTRWGCLRQQEGSIRGWRTDKDERRQHRKRRAILHEVNQRIAPVERAQSALAESRTAAHVERAAAATERGGGGHQRRGGGRDGDEIEPEEGQRHPLQQHDSALPVKAARCELGYERKEAEDQAEDAKDDDAAACVR